MTGLRAESVCDKGWPRPQPWTEGGEGGGLQGDGLGDPQPDLRCAQQVGLHRRARVSHSSMASGWRDKGSWGEEDRPSDLREGPPLTSWAKLGGGRGLTWPAESWCWESAGAWRSSTGPFIPSWAMWALLQEEGEKGSAGGRKELGCGVFLGESPEPSRGRLPDKLCGCLGPAAYTNTRRQRQVFYSHLGSLFWAPALDLDFRGGGGV